MTATKTKTERFTGTSPSALRRRHLAFKAHAAEVLLREASSRNPCSVFEDSMMKVGLCAFRPDHDHDGYRSKRVKVVGETTEEGFLRWKQKTERYLGMMAGEHGYTQDVHKAILREAGFSTEPARMVPVKVVVTLEVTANVRAYKTDGPEELRSQLSDERIRQILYDRYARRTNGGMTWEVSRA